MAYIMKKIIIYLIAYWGFASVSAQQVVRDVVSSGGAKSTSASYLNLSVIGEPVVGITSLGTNETEIGFIFSPAKMSTSITETYLDPQIQLFPNPTHGQFRLEGPTKALDRYEIWTLQGQFLAEHPIEDKIIDQTELAAGIYMIRTYGHDNRLTAILKLYKY